MTKNDIILSTMADCLGYIEHYRLDYDALPFFQFLRNEEFEPLERLQFSKCMAPFIMGFKDLNRDFLRVETHLNPVQAIVNKHTYEDDHHWPWFLEDLEKLGFNDGTSFTQNLAFLWGPETHASRSLTYQLAGMASLAEPIVKLAMVEAIEATGEVLFRCLLPIATQLEQVLNTELRYFGHHHFQRETGHAVNQNGSVCIHAIALSSTQGQKAKATIDRVFELFENWTQELLSYSLTLQETRPTDAKAFHPFQLSNLKLS